MSMLIVGRYAQQGEAENAARQLTQAGFSPAEMSLFYVTPQGQHGLFPLGGDEDESPGTEEAKPGAARGAVGGAGAGALVGAAAIPFLGPAAAAAGAAVGAYTGSLVGALKNMEDREGNAGDAEGELEPRRAGVMLAVVAVTSAERTRAIEILREHAEEVEEAEGTLRNGEWLDFDPRAPVKPVHEA
jgi:uncharacterized membrane protein